MSKGFGAPVHKPKLPKVYAYKIFQAGREIAEIPIAMPKPDTQTLFDTCDLIAEYLAFPNEEGPIARITSALGEGVAGSIQAINGGEPLGDFTGTLYTLDKQKWRDNGTIVNNGKVTDTVEAYFRLEEKLAA